MSDVDKYLMADETRNAKVASEIRDFPQPAVPVSEIFKVEKRSRTIRTDLGHYLEDRISSRLVELMEQKEDLLVADLVNNLAGFMNGLHVNDGAVTRIASSKHPFRPSKTIALCIHIEEYSDLRRLKDFKLYRNMKQLRYARQKFYDGVRGLGYSEIRYLQNPTSEKLEQTFQTLENECISN